MAKMDEWQDSEFTTLIDKHGIQNLILRACSSGIRIYQKQKKLKKKN